MKILKQDIIKFADEFTQCANIIHAVMLEGIKNGYLPSEKTHIIFQDEMSIRNIANSLYIDAINCEINEIDESVENLNTVISQSQQKIQNIKNIKEFIDLTSDILLLGSAIYSAKPSAVLNAVKNLKEHFKNK